MPSTPTVDDRDQSRTQARRERWEALRVLWDQSSLRRVRGCRRAAVEATVSVRVGEDGHAGIGGVATCGSVWACPVCSERINAERQAELTEALAFWLGTGRSVEFLTLTLRHDKGQQLADLWDAVSPCWNAVTSGASWHGGSRQQGDKARFGIAGFVRVVEVKHGAHGWHPHVHALLFLERPLTARERLDLEGRLFGRWERALSRRGLSVVRDYGIDLRPVRSADDALGSYFTKSTYASTPGRAGYEVTGSHGKRQGKGGRSPFDLLREFVATGWIGADDRGEASPLMLWQEYEAASRGRRQLTWSRGLRELIATLGEERTDEEIAAAEDGGDTVAHVLSGDYNRLAWAGAVPDMLNAAERGTLAAFFKRWDVVPVLRQHGSRQGELIGVVGGG